MVDALGFERRKAGIEGQRKSEEKWDDIMENGEVRAGSRQLGVRDAGERGGGEGREVRAIESTRYAVLADRFPANNWKCKRNPIAPVIVR